MGHLLDSTGLQGTVAFNVQTQDLEWTRALAGGLQGVRLPPMSLAGTATAQGSRYGADAVLREGNGLLHLKGDIDTGSPLTYEATLQTSQLQLRHFLPSLAAGPLTAKGTVKGAGTDFMSRSTRLDAELRLTQASYAAYDLNGTTLEARIGGGRGHARVQADNSLMNLQADLDALLARKTDFTLSVDLGNANLQALGIADHPLKTAFCLHIDGTTDFERHHRLQGHVNDILLMPYDSIFHPEDVTLEALLEPDTTYAFVSSGDLSLRMRGHTGYDKLLKQLNHFTDELQRQLKAASGSATVIRAGKPAARQHGSHGL